VLTETGAGTPMGELLRRYWWPLAGASELAEPGAKPVRLLGEDLVLYKDLGGRYGLLDRHCRHRRADLSYGYVEECGLRCNYHGWLYGADGACLAQPYEDLAHPDSRLKDEIRIKAYPVEQLGGLLWAYLGPEPRPLVPDWEFFSWPNGFVQIVKAEIPCNWFQCQENSIDPVHFEWTHSNWSVRLGGAAGPYTPQHLRVDFNEFDYGFQYKRIRTDTDEQDPLWTIGRVCLWPAALFTGNHIEYRVPIDDENTLSITWVFSRVPKEREPYVQNSIPTWAGPIADAATGRWITSHVMNQDFVTWVGQGRIADRSQEYLAPSDRGIVMIRRRFLSDLEALRQGREPKAVLRDPSVNCAIRLPVAERDALTQGFSRDRLISDPLAGRSLKGYVFQTGQPPEVREAFLAAMGFTEAEVAAARPPSDPTLVPGGR
jgi:5,5'-dehydrodivanillate O-demethylase oxygenase subunit